MFDSPFEFCQRCREFVLLDQTQRECAREHRCRDASGCPLRRFFTGIEFAGKRHRATEPGCRTPGPASAPSPPVARRRKT